VITRHITNAEHLAKLDCNGNIITDYCLPYGSISICIDLISFWWYWHASSSEVKQPKTLQFLGPTSQGHHHHHFRFRLCTSGRNLKVWTTIFKPGSLWTCYKVWLSSVRRLPRTAFEKRKNASQNVTAFNAHTWAGIITHYTGTCTLHNTGLHNTVTSSTYD